MNGERMYSLLEKLNFVRVSATEAEARAAKILMDECASFGLDAHEETFETPDGEVLETKLTVLEPYRKEYDALGFRRGASVDAEAEVVYIEDGLEANLADVKGKIVLMNGGIGKDKYEPLLKSGALCVIVSCGDARDNPADIDLRPGMFRPIITDKYETRLCAATVRASDLFEMIAKGASRAQVKIETRDFTGTSRNVVAEIPGTVFPEQVFAITGHFDSVEYSHGMYDNAAGSAIMMELARCCKANPPRRTLRFVWTGSEERGLLGSKAFVKAHADEVEKTRLCVNLDLAGSIAGHEFAIVTGPDSLKNHIDMMMKEQGWAVECRADTYSSDCIPFADCGVPAVSIGRFGAPSMSYIHDRRDVIDYVCASALEKTGKIAAHFLKRMDDAVMLPFPREMPEEMKKKVDDYLQKEKK